MIDESIFRRAQQLLKEQYVRLSDEQLLKKLREALAAYGKLSVSISIMAATDGMPSPPLGSAACAKPSAGSATSTPSAIRLPRRAATIRRRVVEAGLRSRHPHSSTRRRNVRCRIEGDDH